MGRLSGKKNIREIATSMFGFFLSSPFCSLTYFLSPGSPLPLPPPFFLTVYSLYLTNQILTELPSVVELN